MLKSFNIAVACLAVHGLAQPINPHCHHSDCLSSSSVRLNSISVLPSSFRPEIVHVAGGHTVYRLPGSTRWRKCPDPSKHQDNPCGDAASDQGQQQDQPQESDVEKSIPNEGSSTSTELNHKSAAEAEAEANRIAATIPAEICNAPASDNDSAFLENAVYINEANHAQTPRGFSQSFKGLNHIALGSPISASPLSIHVLNGYDTESCAALCRQKAKCSSINVYVERGHMATPCDRCPNPSSKPRYICVQFEKPICDFHATNRDQWRHSFHVLHTASNGYNLGDVPATCDATQGDSGSSASQKQTSSISSPTQPSYEHPRVKQPSVTRHHGFNERYAYPTQAFSIPNYRGVWTAKPTTGADGLVKTVVEPCTKTDLASTVVVTNAAARPTGSGDQGIWRFKLGKSRSREHWRYKPGHSRSHHRQSEGQFRYKLHQKVRASLERVSNGPPKELADQDGWYWDPQHEEWYFYGPGDAELSEPLHSDKPLHSDTPPHSDKPPHSSKLDYKSKLKNEKHEHLVHSEHKRSYHSSKHHPSFQLGYVHKAKDRDYKGLGHRLKHKEYDHLRITQEKRSYLSSKHHSKTVSDYKANDKEDKALGHHWRHSEHDHSTHTEKKRSPQLIDGLNQESLNQEGWYWNPKREEWCYYSPDGKSKYRHSFKLGYDRKLKLSERERSAYSGKGENQAGMYWNPETEKWIHFIPAQESKLIYDRKTKHTERERLADKMKHSARENLGDKTKNSERERSGSADKSKGGQRHCCSGGGFVAPVSNRQTTTIPKASGD